MRNRFFQGRFLCPECGSSQHNSLHDPQKHENGRGRRYTCTICQFEIPVHLAERWGGISFEDAKREWQEVYRPLERPFQQGRPYAPATAH